MNTLFANGLFDSPWLIAIFLIVGAISNWLMKRRQEKEADDRPEGKPPPLPDKPEGEFNLEEALRRLLGGEPQPPPAPPPLIPRTTPAKPPPIEDWTEEEGLRPEPTWPEEVRDHRNQTAPAVRLPPIAGRVPPVASTVAAEAAAQAPARLAAISEMGNRPAAGVEQGQAHGRRARASRRATFWRDPRNARQAFVASVIFAPPKGLQL
jgi:hypothetical protein